MEERGLDNNRLDVLHLIIFQIAESLSRISINLDEQFWHEISEIVCTLRGLAEKNDEDESESSVCGKCVHVIYGSGRPKFVICEDQLRYFLNNCFTAMDIASMLGVSIRTIRRRMATIGLNLSNYYYH